MTGLTDHRDDAFAAALGAVRGPLDRRQRIDDAGYRDGADRHERLAAAVSELVDAAANPDTGFDEVLRLVRRALRAGGWRPFTVHWWWGGGDREKSTLEALRSLGLDPTAFALSPDDRDRLNTVPEADALLALLADEQSTDADIAAAAKRLCLLLGFTPWGHDGWVHDRDGGGTCYDTAWALSDSELPLDHDTYERLSHACSEVH